LFYTTSVCPLIVAPTRIDFTFTSSIALKVTAAARQDSILLSNQRYNISTVEPVEMQAVGGAIQLAVREVLQVGNSVTQGYTVLLCIIRCVSDDVV
jgi:hypothetical protein